MGVSIDLSTAFDTVDHDILLMKLSMYGIKTTTVKKSTCRQENNTYRLLKTKHKRCKSDVVVPQGSILGPLLFLFNDLSKASKLLNSITFADDTNLFYSSS